MEWEPFVEEGLLVAEPEAKSQSLTRLNDAWDGAILARKECLAFHYPEADAAIRVSMTDAGESLCNYYGYRFAKRATFEASQRVCSAFFKPGIADAVFERALIMSNMMPLPNVRLDEDSEKRVRHCVGGSAELCAMVEAFVFFQ